MVDVPLISPEKRQSVIGIVISTYGAAPYVELGLKSRHLYYPENPILVHDDHSDSQRQLLELCDIYGADFVTNPISFGHQRGDLSSVANGLVWAELRGIDILVKFSRRFIAHNNWPPTLQVLALDSQGHTFANEDHTFGFDPRCFGMLLTPWAEQLEKISAGVDKRLSLCEIYLHNIARKIEATYSNKTYTQYRSQHPRPPDRNAYVVWPMMSNSRAIPKAGTLWHHCNTVNDYAAVAQQMGLHYTEADFELSARESRRD